MWEVSSLRYDTKSVLSTTLTTHYRRKLISQRKIEKTYRSELIIRLDPPMLTSSAVRGYFQFAMFMIPEVCGGIRLDAMPPVNLSW